VRLSQPACSRKEALIVSGKAILCRVRRDAEQFQAQVILNIRAPAADMTYDEMVMQRRRQ